jgi:hypothetical protein
MSTGLVDRNEHVRRITVAWQKTVGNVVETGRLLIEAKDDIGYGGFEEMTRTDLPFGPRTAQRIMQIAEDPVLSNPTHASHLPASWMTLYELSRLPKRGIDLLVLIEDGAIHPKMERKDTRALLPPPKPGPEPERDDDLPPDYEGSAEPEVEKAKPANKRKRRERRELMVAEVKRLASKLVELDRDTAQALHKLCLDDVLGWQYQLEGALARELGLEIEGNEPSAGNGVDSDASAAIRKAQFAEDAERWIEGDPS